MYKSILCLKTSSLWALFLWLYLTSMIYRYTCITIPRNCYNCFTKYNSFNLSCILICKRLISGTMLQVSLRMPAQPHILLQETSPTESTSLNSAEGNGCTLPAPTTPLTHTNLYNEDKCIETVTTKRSGYQLPKDIHT